MRNVHNQKSQIVTQNNHTKTTYINQYVYPDNRDPNRRVLSRPDEISSYLDRSKELAELKEQFSDEARVVVLHGHSGHGKSTLANLFFQAYESEYEQVGWINQRSNIWLSLVESFASFVQVGPAAEQKTENDYKDLATLEVNKLENHSVRRLLVIAGVENWDEVLSFKRLLNLSRTDFLITATTPLPENVRKWYKRQFINYPVPLITAGELQRTINEYAQRQLSLELYEEVRGNLFLYDLIGKQADVENPKALVEYLEKVLAPTAESASDLVVNILREQTLYAPELWLLLQFMVLPPAAYGVKELENLLFKSDRKNWHATTVGELPGYESFSFAYPDFTEGAEDDLPSILTYLSETGWLRQAGEAYLLHASLRTGLQKYFEEVPTRSIQRLPIDCFGELAQSLSESFFLDFSTAAFLDHLYYLRHLNHFMEAVPDQPDRRYIDLLWKLIGIKEGMGRWAEELPLRERHLALLARQKIVDQDNLLGAKADYIDCLNRNGKYGQTIRVAATFLPPEPDESLAGKLVVSLFYLSHAYQFTGKYNLALKQLQLVRFILENRVGDQPFLANTYYEIGSLHHSLGNYMEALTWLEKTRLITKKIHDSDHPGLATTYHEFGRVHHSLGNYMEALTWLKKARDIYEKIHDPDHPHLAGTCHVIGRIHYSLGNFVKSLIWLEKAQEIYEKVYDSDHPHLAATYHEIGLVKQSMGDYGTSLELLEKARMINEKVYDSDHLLLSCNYQSIGINWLLSGNLDKALSFLHRAMAISNNQLFVRFWLGEYALATGDISGAHEQLTDVHQNQVAILGADHPDAAHTEGVLGITKLRLGEAEKGKQLLRSAIEKLRAKVNADHPWILRFEAELG